MAPPLLAAALWYLCIALPAAGFWAFPERRWIWMFALFGVSFAGVLAKAIGDPSEPLEIGLTGGPRALAMLVPVAMVAGDHWTVLRRHPLFWIAVLVAGALLANLVMAVVQGEAWYNKDAIYCWDVMEAAAAKCRLNPWLLGSAAIGYAGQAIAICGTIPALAILGFAGWWRRRPRSAS
jgi:hypothetical protein